MAGGISVLEWFTLLGLVLGIVVLIGALGYLPLRILGLRSPQAVVLSPPVGLGILGLLTLVNGVVGWRWSWWQVCITLVLLIAAFLLAEWKDAARGPRLSVPEISGRTARLVVVGILLFAVIQTVALVITWPGAAAIQSFGDAQFHYNGIQLLLDGASTSPFGGLSAMYDPGGQGAVYYPTLWHSLVSLFSFGDRIVLASNAAVIATGSVFWPWSLAMLGLITAPKSRFVTLFVPLFALLCTVFPGNLVFRTSIHPLGLGLAFLPAGIAIVLLIVDNARSPAAYFLGVMAAVGLFAAHPSVGLLLMVVVGISILGAILQLSATLWSRGAKMASSSVVIVASLAVFTLFAVVLRSDYVSNLGMFSRESKAYTEVVATLLSGTLASAPLFPNVSLVLLWLCVFGFAILGIWTMRNFGAARVLLASGLTYGLLFVLAGGPENRLRALTGPWWKDDTRLLVPFLIVTLVFASVGASRVVCRLIDPPIEDRRRWFGLVGFASLLLVVVIVLPAALSTGRTLGGYAKLGYSLDPRVPSVLDEDRVVVLEAASAAFEDGEVLVGSYSSGVGFVSVFGGVDSFYPRPLYSSGDQSLLATEFDQILTDPQVCEAIERHGIVGLMIDSGTPVNRRDPAYAGFYNVDVGSGFELVAQSGGISLWRITACDDTN